MDMKVDPRMLASQAVIKNPDLQSKKDNPEELKKACQQFEALFVHSLFKEMRKTVPSDGFLPANGGQEMFRELMDWEVAQKASRTQSVGIAEALYRQLSHKKD